MHKPKIAIAGASGFVGRWLIQQLLPSFDVIALSRSPIQSDDPGLEWRCVDLFSVTSTTEALVGCDFAVYLVHSMQPNSRLTQGTFEDNDLIIADNFSIACETHNIKQIVYLSGIIPRVDQLSEHLRSRFEVEEILASRNSALTTLRAGMVVGPKGSSFRIMELLLKRLPMMILPAWTQTPSQAVALSRVIASLVKVINNPTWYNRSIDLGCADIINYAQMLRRCGKFLNLRRFYISIPIKSTSFSKLWVSLVSGTPIELASPLIDSLKYPIIPNLDSMKELGTFEQQSFETLLTEALRDVKLERLKKNRVTEVKENNVRSIQRLPSLPSLEARDLANEYMLWLPKFFKFFIKVIIHNQKAYFKCLGFTLLELTHIEQRSNSTRHLFFITGGVLCKRHDHGWLEFRQINNRKWTISAIHEFVPTLPWWIYRFTQAPLHSFVMKRFGRYLKKKYD
ncbi:MAG: epimerase [Halobacteriovorax sp.]|nr:epimerase [Halobacteriovorax sp.]